ncbi:MAG: hypothetical protein JO147_14560, partial [Actinobacteria bacterium]|nr:hypothetical protein [Actinomycetota bacterium]
MYKKIALAGGTAAVIIGLGTAALAESGAVGATPSPTTSSSSSASGSASGANGTAGAGVFGKLRRVAHGSIVAKDKNGTFVTHDVA